MALLFLVMLVAAAGNTAMQSILPAIGTRLGVPDVWVAVAFSWSALLWVFSAPRWAAISERRGRRVLMAVGLAGFASSMLLCGVALHAGLQGWIGAGVTFILFAVFRSLYGALGSASPPAVQAYIAARTEGEERVRSLSLIASSFGLGTVIGPAVAPWLVLPVVGLAGPLFVFAGVALATLVALRSALPSDDPRFAARGRIAAYPANGSGALAVQPDSPHIDESPQPPLRWGDPRVRPWLLAGLIGGHAQAVLFGIIGFVVLDRLDLRATPMEAVAPTGIILFAGAAATLIAQWGLIPVLHIRPRGLVLWGAASVAVGATVLGFATDLYALVYGYAIAAIGFGLFRPGFTAGASLAVGWARQDTVAGMVASVNGAAYVIGPTMGVLLYNTQSWAGFALVAGFALFLLAWGRTALAR